MTFFGKLAFATTILSLSLLTGCISQPSSSSSTMIVVPSAPTVRIGVERYDVVELDMPNGEVTVEGADIDFVEASMKIRCPERSQSCLSRSAKTSLTTRRRDGRIRLGFEDMPGNDSSVIVSVSVPRDHPLMVNMKYGELSIVGVEDDVTARLQAGELSIDMPELAVSEVHLAARFGDASISMPERSIEGRRRMLVGARADWTRGPGAHIVSGRVKYGEVQVELLR